LTPFMKKPLIKTMRRHQTLINWKSLVMLLLWQPKQRKKFHRLRSQMCTRQNFLKMQKNLPNMINYRILNINSNRIQQNRRLKFWIKLKITLTPFLRKPLIKRLCMHQSSMNR
jgi:hypothetical protein